ncbi:MAG: hypothetical protein KGO49_06945 [Gammaproteobacteria bacterium]|nr:hypothetical protein [Gammaproteobacteria bacterium]
MKAKAVVLTLMAMMPFANVNAEDNGNCTLIALTSVSSVQMDGSSNDGFSVKLKKGQTDAPVTQYWTNKTIDVYCVHGGECWPRNAVVNGKKIEVTRLTNCKAKATPEKHESFDDPTQNMYRLIEIHKK